MAHTWYNLSNGTKTQHVCVRPLPNQSPNPQPYVTLALGLTIAIRVSFNLALALYKLQGSLVGKGCSTNVKPVCSKLYSLSYWLFRSRFTPYPLNACSHFRPQICFDPYHLPLSMWYRL